LGHAGAVFALDGRAVGKQVRTGDISMTNEGLGSSAKARTSVTGEKGQSWSGENGKRMDLRDSSPAATTQVSTGLKLQSTGRSGARCGSAAVSGLATRDRESFLARGVKDIAVSHDDPVILATGGTDHVVFLWKVANGRQCLGKLTSQRHWVVAVRLNMQQQMLVSMSKKEIHVFR